MKHMASAKLSGKSSAKARSKGHGGRGLSFVTCMRNDGYEVSLEIGKVYVSLPDRAAAKYGRIRVIDESEEDYLFPVEYFLPVVLSNPVRAALSA